MSYGDVIPILQLAASRPDGVRYRLASYGKAVNFRQRCYRYRAQVRKAQAIGELILSTPYDDLVISLETPDGRQVLEKIVGPVDVVISHQQITGELLDGEGNKIEIKEAYNDQSVLDD